MVLSVIVLGLETLIVINSYIVIDVEVFRQRVSAGARGGTVVGHRVCRHGGYQVYSDLFKNVSQWEGTVDTAAGVDRHSQIGR